LVDFLVSMNYLRSPSPEKSLGTAVPPATVDAPAVAAMLAGETPTTATVSSISPPATFLSEAAAETVSEEGVLLLDADGRVARVGGGAERLFDLPAATLDGMSWDALRAASGLPADAQLPSATGDGPHFTIEVRRRSGDGDERCRTVGIVPLSWDERRGVGYAFTIRNLTTIRRSEESLREIVEHSLNAIVLVDRQGVITSVNAQTEKMFGYSRRRLIGLPVETLVPERFRDEHPRNRDAFFARPVVRPMGAGRDLYGRRSDGSEFPVEIGLSPIQTADGPGALASIVDITERKESEARVRKHLADLAHVARLSTVGQMFSELAHEINQPLAAAANYARACVAFARTDGGASPEQMTDWMEKTAAQTARAIDIVKRLGSFVKKDGGARTPVDVNELVEEVVRLSVPALQSTAEGAPPLELSLELDPAVPVLFVDRVQIEQVLLNLVRNAIEAMQERHGRPPRLTLRTDFDDAWVTISVVDTGPGITVENRRRLFDPYFTTKPSGIGLGLSISRSIAEDHGGELAADSSPEGTTFRVKLPLARSGKPS